MVQRSAIGIIIIQKEGAPIIRLRLSNNVCTNIFDAVDLVDNPKQICATLRI